MPYNPTWVPLDTEDSVGLVCPYLWVTLSGSPREFYDMHSRINNRDLCPVSRPA